MSSLHTAGRGMYAGFVPGFVVISGSMFAGKSEELIRRLKRWKRTDLGVITFKPVLDTRSENITSRNGCSLEAIEVHASAQMIEFVKETDKIIGVDEIHFFDPDLPKVLLELVRMGKLVIAAGLSTDFNGEPFENTMRAMALATEVTIEFAVCDICQSQYAVRSQLLVPSSSRILVGDKDEYSPRCIECFEPPSQTPT